jgi:hypothetical protein
LKFKVIGYYDHNNIGDSQYKLTITFFLYKLNLLNSTEDISFIDCDTLTDQNNVSNLNPEDIYIIGGGDVLCEYFINTLDFFNNQKFNSTKIISLSSGVPYINFSIIKKLNFIDYFFVRSKKDEIKLSVFYPNRVFYLQDMSFLLKEVTHKMPQINNNLQIFKKADLQTICICPTEFGFKNNIVLFNKFTNLITQLSKHYIIYIYPFGENDYPFCYKLFKASQNKHVFLSSNLEENYLLIESFFKKFDFIIPMRFHSVLFSCMYEVPMFPIFSTFKIQKFLSDIDYPYFYFFNNTNTLNIDSILNQLKIFDKRKNNLNEKFQNIINKFNLQNFIKDAAEYNISDKFLTKSDKSTNYIISNTDIFTSLNKMAGINDFRKITDEEMKKRLVKFVSFLIVGNTHSIYNWGLEQKMFNLNYQWQNEFDWIINDHFINSKHIKLAENTNGLFNLTFIDQIDYSKCHRSGWDYVYKNLVQFNNSESDLLLDLYIDKTFGWDYAINEYLEIIPYTTKWIGFIHHTFNTEIGKNNIFELFEKPLFLQSLQKCSGLFVLSNYLKKQLVFYLQKYNLKIPVYFITHPSEIHVSTFNYNTFKTLFKSNKHKVLHIGGWLRNIYSFYKLEIPNKYILRGTNNQDYIHSDNVITTLETALKTQLQQQNNTNSNISSNISSNTSSNVSSNISSNISCNISSNVSTNNNVDDYIISEWNRQFLKDLSKIINSVQIIDKLDNQQYDEILTCNIVFINLLDASAVNTVIECIIRNTPIFINKTEFTIEMLGEKYPLFYNNPLEVLNLLNLKNIKKAHIYLSKLNKDKYNINTFLQHFTDIVKKL